jgi:hypothetical protein
MFAEHSIYWKLCIGLEPLESLHLPKPPDLLEPLDLLEQPEQLDVLDVPEQTE